MAWSQAPRWCWSWVDASYATTVPERARTHPDSWSLYSGLHFVRMLSTLLIISWFVTGALLAAVALKVLDDQHPLDYKLPLYSQFAMIGLLALIYLILPESPWWLVSAGKDDSRTRSVLLKLKQGVPDYDVDLELEVMKNTVDEQRRRSKYEGSIPVRAIFQGLNGKRLIIALWPKLTQQFVGLSVFNSYAAYFCEFSQDLAND
jgi:SP family general alpha glucoside:H+ symporter-like MFS transporter